MRIKINLKIFIFILIFALTKQIKIYAYLMIFAFIHELGHLFTGLILGLKPETLKIMPFGISIFFKTNKNIKRVNIKKLLIVVAGPLVNIIIALIGICLKINMDIIYANILIAIFNLLPIYPLDGGRILKVLLSIKYSTYTYEKYVIKVSNITLILLTLITSIIVLYLKNIALVFVIIYLWGILIRENRKFILKERVYNIIKKNQEYIDN